MELQKLTTEQLADRWMDWREIENLVTRRTFYRIYGWHRKEYEDLWCQTAEPCLGTNQGYYSGRAAVRDYYAALDKLAAAKGPIAKAAFPKELDGLSPEECRGAGDLVVRNCTTPLIELAGDGQTAKGMWYIFGTDNGLQPYGPASNWVLGKLGIDFIREKDGWKIWHLIFAEDLNSPVGQNWADTPEKPAPAGVYAALADLALPAPNIPRPLYRAYDAKRPLRQFPPIPVPYQSFDQTFSYGAEEAVQ